MKTSKPQSPYSKMYLIPPNMYEKLLTCLDERETRQTQNLNVEEEAIQERPSERQIDILNQQALNPEPIENPQPETQMAQQEANPETQNIPSENVENIDNPPEVLPEYDEDMTLAEMRAKKNREIRGRLTFQNPKLTFPCEVCLKVFKKKYDLKRHFTSVHRNIIEQRAIAAQKPEIILSEQNIPSQLNVRQTVTPAFIGDDDTEMMTDIFPRTPKKGCNISADTTERVIPELYFRPPKKSIIVQQIKKSMLLKPSISKRKQIIPLKAKEGISITSKLPMKKFPLKKTISDSPIPISKEQEDLMNFEDWEESKKRGTRTASEAQLKMKPSKYKMTEFDKWDS